MFELASAFIAELGATLREGRRRAAAPAGRLGARGSGGAGGAPRSRGRHRQDPHGRVRLWRHRQRAPLERPAKSLEPGRTPGTGRVERRRRRLAPGRDGGDRIRQRHGRLGADTGELRRHRRAQDQLRTLVARRHRAPQPVARHLGHPDPLGRGRGACFHGHRPPLRCAAPPPPAGLSGLRFGVLEALFDGCAPPEVDVAREAFTAGGLAGPEYMAFVNHELPDFHATLDPNESAALVEPFRDRSMTASQRRQAAAASPQ